MRKELFQYASRLPFMMLAMAALLAGLWAGLIRLGWAWPVLQPTLPIAHGPLMVSGFLGTVIGLERAVALKRGWTYVGPLLTGLGGLALLVGLPGPLGPLLITLGSLSLVAVFWPILRLHTALFTVTMALGALLWLAGNLLWLAGWPVPTVVYWWAGFLILTIAGERLELNRVLQPTGRVRLLFLAANGLFLAGLVVSTIRFDPGVRLAGSGLLALALWLLRFDIARYTVRKTGLTRFIAVCLLIGYTWLGLGGLLMLLLGGVTAGFYYDALLHAIFVGFVISMIFGHAPIILPAVLKKAIHYSPLFYSHLVLLHLSLLVRVTGDLAGWLPGRTWGGLFNEIAILLFIGNTIRAGIQASRLAQIESGRPTGARRNRVRPDNAVQ